MIEESTEMESTEMESTEIASIDRTLELDASIDRVWKALTAAGDLGSWFPNAGAKFEATPGFVGAFTWEFEGEAAECDGGDYAVEVVEVEPMRKISWRWAREPNVPIEEAFTTLVEWTLSERPGGGTRLEMCESGFQREEDREGNVGGWKAELAELEEMLAG